MNVENKTIRSVVCEGYQVLLRAEATLILPVEQVKIRDFYEKLAGSCMRWATEVHGESLRREYLMLEGVRERSAFRVQHYRLCMRIAHEDAYFAAVVGESNLTDQWREPQKSYHRISQVWDLREESVLPLSQILAQFGMHLSRGMLPFRPDGVYPEGEFVVCFRNVTDQTPFLERKLPRNYKKLVKKE